MSVAWFFGDSFDLYTNINDALGYWDQLGFSPAGGLGPGRFGSPGQSFSVSTFLCAINKTSGLNHNIHHFNFAFQQPLQFGVPNNSRNFFVNLNDGGAVQCSFGFDGQGNMYLFSGSKLTGTMLGMYNSAYLIYSQWYVYEVEVVIHPTAGSFTVRANNSATPTFQLTGINTQHGSANSYANLITIGCGGGLNNNQYIDDFLWRSDTVAVPWLGDVRTYIRSPNADILKQFTPLTGTANYAMVNEPHEDKLTSYVYSSTPGNNDLYTVSPISPPPALPPTVIGVTTRGYMQKIDAGSRAGVVQLKSGSTIVQSAGGGTFITADIWWWYWRTDQTDPATSATWTAAAVDAAQIGPALVN